jgi:hypothetical protein
MKIKQLVACAVFAALIRSPADAQQPVLRYTFDEASGNALDTGAAPDTNATFEGGATRSTDTPSGSGMSLDLRTDADYAHLLGPDAAELDGLAALTLTTWLKVETYPDATSNNKRLLAKQTTGATFPGFSFNMNATRVDLENDPPASPSAIRLGLFLGSADAFDSGLSDAYVDATQWAFIATTYDSALGEIKFYTGDVDSPVSQLGTTIFTTLNPTPVDGADARFAVGLTDAANTADTSVTGWQDDVRVYGAALDLATLEAVRMENLQGGADFDGDFNEDGKVDGLDLTAWRTGFGVTGTATHMQGDADTDLDVDGADFLVWQKELGSGVPPGAAVPEPTAGLLLALSIAACGYVVRQTSQH